MKKIWIFNIIIWLITSYLIGWNIGWKQNNKDWIGYLKTQLVSDIPKGSILLSRDDGTFLIGRIANEETRKGLQERFDKNLPIEIIK